MNINRHHRLLLKQIVTMAKAEPFHSTQGSAYAGHKEKTYNLSNLQLRKIAKDWVKENKEIFLEELVKLLNSIYQQSQSATEKYLGGFLIEYLPKQRKWLSPLLLDDWLENLTGWGQVDSLCQSKFGAKDMLDHWIDWKKMMKKFNYSKNVSKRRASLVLLTRPVRESEDKKFVSLALENIDHLKGEKDILITKAISWLLREMVKLHGVQVSEYLKENKNLLPSIAVREVTRKLKTGRK